MEGRRVFRRAIYFSPGICLGKYIAYGSIFDAFQGILKNTESLYLLEAKKKNNFA